MSEKFGENFNNTVTPKEKIQEGSRGERSPFLTTVHEIAHATRENTKKHFDNIVKGLIDKVFDENFVNFVTDENGQYALDKEFVESQKEILIKNLGSRNHMQSISGMSKSVRDGSIVDSIHQEIAILAPEDNVDSTEQSRVRWREKRAAKKQQEKNLKKFEKLRDAFHSEIAKANLDGLKNGLDFSLEKVEISSDNFSKGVVTISGGKESEAVPKVPMGEYRFNGAEAETNEKSSSDILEEGPSINFDVLDKRRGQFNTEFKERFDKSVDPIIRHIFSTDFIGTLTSKEEERKKIEEDFINGVITQIKEKLLKNLKALEVRPFQNKTGILLEDMVKKDLLIKELNSAINSYEVPKSVKVPDSLGIIALKEDLRAKVPSEKEFLKMVEEGIFNQEKKSQGGKETATTDIPVEEVPAGNIAEPDHEGRAPTVQQESVPDGFLEVVVPPEQSVQTPDHQGDKVPAVENSIEALQKESVAGNALEVVFKEKENYARLMKSALEIYTSVYERVMQDIQENGKEDIILPTEAHEGLRLKMKWWLREQLINGEKAGQVTYTEETSQEDVVTGFMADLDQNTEQFLQKYVLQQDTLEKKE